MVTDAEHVFSTTLLSALGPLVAFWRIAPSWRTADIGLPAGSRNVGQRSVVLRVARQAFTRSSASPKFAWQVPNGAELRRAGRPIPMPQGRT